MMFYLLCRICCMFRIGPFPPLCALRQVSHSPESGRLIFSFLPAGIFFPARAQRPSRAPFCMVNSILSILHKTKRLNYVEFIHFCTLCLKAVINAFSNARTGRPPSSFSTSKKGTGQPSLPRALFPFCAKNGPLRYQRPALRLFTFRSDSCRCPSPPSRWGRTRRRRPSSPR